AELAELGVLRAAGVGLALPEADRLLLVGEALGELLAARLCFGERLCRLRQLLLETVLALRRLGELLLEAALRLLQRLEVLFLLCHRAALALEAALGRPSRFCGLVAFGLELGLLALELRLLRREALVGRLQAAQRFLLAFLVLRLGRAGSEQQHGERDGG